MAKRIVTIGGGTGNFVVLSGLKNRDLNLKAIVTMSDSGGSSGVLRDEYGVLPPGDVRQCLVALSHAPDQLRKLFLYRFSGGPFDGHNFGNIFLSALEKTSGSMDKAVSVASRILNVTGRVIPVTNEPTELCVELENGEHIIGETNIDEPTHDGNLRIKRTYLTPKNITANPKAIEAIRKADMIVIGPGDVFTSLMPVLLVPGISDAVKASSAEKVFITNLMKKYGQTNRMNVRGTVEAIEALIGAGELDHILMNNAPIPQDIVDYYKKHNEEMLGDDMEQDPRVVRRNIISDTQHKKAEGDTLTRSILRHSPEKVASALLELL